jgi:sulfopropanediol 3-dehydrogenase
MVGYLKKAQPQEESVTQKVRDAVSEILSAVEKEGIAAVGRYSERFDDWNPESFVVSEEEIRRAEDSVDDELKGHIRFAQEQVENFARLQKETLVDFEKETLPGVVLGQKQIPHTGRHRAFYDGIVFRAEKNRGVDHGVYPSC